LSGDLHGLQSHRRTAEGFQRFLSFTFALDLLFAGLEFVASFIEPIARDGEAQWQRSTALLGSAKRESGKS
jgi:hypothetical protein